MSEAVVQDKLLLVYDGTEAGRGLDTVRRGLGSSYTIEEVTPDDVSDIDRKLAEAHVIWLERVSEHTAVVSRMLSAGEHGRVVCRVNGDELFTPHWEQLQWAEVDDLIFPSTSIATIVEQARHSPVRRAGRCHVIAPGVDVERFPTISGDGPRKVAFVSPIGFHTGPLLLMQATAALLRADPDVEVHIAGAHLEPRYPLYFEQFCRDLDLSGRVHFYDEVTDRAAWLADKTHILCTSVFEGHPTALLEAIAQGLTPLIHDFVSADGVFAPEALWTTVDELVVRYQTSVVEPAANREFVRTRHDPTREVASLVELFEAPVRTVPLLNRRIRGERAQVREEIDRSVATNDVGRTLDLWYHDHYLPKTQFSSLVEWHATRASIESLRGLAATNAERHRAAMTQRPKPPAADKTLFVFELLDFDNPVLRHFYNLLRLRDRAAHPVDVTARVWSTDDHPRAQAMRRSEEMIEAAGCTVQSLGSGSMVDRMHKLIELSLTGGYSQVVFHTGFQVSYLIYAAQVIRALAPELRQVGFLWDYIESGADEFAPYDRVISVFEPNRRQVTKLPFSTMRYLYMRHDKEDGPVDNQAAHAQLERVRAAAGVEEPVVFCTMVGQSHQRGRDREFWTQIQRVLSQVPEAILIVIGLNPAQIEPFFGDSPVLRRVLATGFADRPADYLRLAKLYVDTFVTGGTSMWEAFDNGIPVFQKRTPFYDQPMYNFPEEFVVDPERLLVDTVDDHARWSEQLTSVLNERDRLDEMNVVSRRYADENAARIDQEVSRVFGLITARD